MHLSSTSQEVRIYFKLKSCSCRAATSLRQLVFPRTPRNPLCCPLRRWQPDGNETPDPALFIIRIDKTSCYWVQLDKIVSMKLYNINGWNCKYFLASLRAKCSYTGRRKACAYNILLFIQNQYNTGTVNKSVKYLINFALPGKLLTLRTAARSTEFKYIRSLRNRSINNREKIVSIQK